MYQEAIREPDISHDPSYITDCPWQGEGDQQIGQLLHDKLDQWCCPHLLQLFVDRFCVRCVVMLVLMYKHHHTAKPPIPHNIHNTHTHTVTHTHSHSHSHSHSHDTCTIQLHSHAHTHMMHSYACVCTYIIIYMYTPTLSHDLYCVLYTRSHTHPFITIMAFYFH